MAQPVSEAVETELAPDGGKQRNHHQQDQQGRINEQAHRERDGGDDELGLAEDLAKNGGTRGGLAAGALELVLIGRLLEMHEVELDRMAHQLDADAIGMEFALERIEHFDGALGEAATEDEGKFAEQIDAEQIEPAGLEPVGLDGTESGLAHDFVDDELGEEQDQRRLHRDHEAQHHGAGHEARTGPPHLAEQPAEMAQRLQTLTFLKRQDFGKTGRRAHCYGL